MISAHFYGNNLENQNDYMYVVNFFSNVYKYGKSVYILGENTILVPIFWNHN